MFVTGFAVPYDTMRVIHTTGERRTQQNMGTRFKRERETETERERVKPVTSLGVV